MASDEALRNAVHDLLERHQVGAAIPPNLLVAYRAKIAVDLVSLMRGVVR